MTSAYHRTQQMKLRIALLKAVKDYFDSVPNPENPSGFDDVIGLEFNIKLKKPIENINVIIEI